MVRVVLLKETKICKIFSNQCFQHITYHVVQSSAKNMRESLKLENLSNQLPWSKQPRFFLASDIKKPSMSWNSCSNTILRSLGFHFSWAFVTWNCNTIPRESRIYLNEKTTHLCFSAIMFFGESLKIGFVSCNVYLCRADAYAAQNKVTTVRQLVNLKCIKNVLNQ